MVHGCKKEEKVASTHKTQSMQALYNKDLNDKMYFVKKYINNGGGAVAQCLIAQGSPV